MYTGLLDSIANAIEQISISHSGAVQAAFEREVGSTERLANFWSEFIDLPEFQLDTAAISLLWGDAVASVNVLLQAKQAAPLQPISLDDDTVEKLRKYQEAREAVSTSTDGLVVSRESIDLVKERIAATEISALESDLRNLEVTRRRFQADAVGACSAYQLEKAEKSETEVLRDNARNELSEYREHVFPEYQASINDYLQRFNAGFRLAQVDSVNTRRGSTCSYSVLINEHEVPISTGENGTASFRNTLSAGDRNTLALAFFFASLSREPDRAQCTVVIDDPMTSLDEHRTLTTVQELRILANDVAQVIVLSHSKPFLCNIWQGTAPALRTAMRIVRSNPGFYFFTLGCKSGLY